MEDCAPRRSQATRRQPHQCGVLTCQDTCVNLRSIGKFGCRATIWEIRHKMEQVPENCQHTDQSRSVSSRRTASQKANHIPLRQQRTLLLALATVQIPINTCAPPTLGSFPPTLGPISGLLPSQRALCCISSGRMQTQLRTKGAVHWAKQPQGALHLFIITFTSFLLLSLWHTASANCHVARGPTRPSEHAAHIAIYGFCCQRESNDGAMLLITLHLRTASTCACVCLTIWFCVVSCQ